MSKFGCLVSTSGAALAVSGLTLLAPLSAWAQIEEIVVTTRKVAENIQDVPIAVDAISSEQIERRGIGNVADVVKLSTSVQFDQSFGPSDTRISVRGLQWSRTIDGETTRGEFLGDAERRAMILEEFGLDVPENGGGHK